MPEREGFPAGVPAWIDTDQSDPGAAAQFYAGLFGWRFQNRMPAGSPHWSVAFAVADTDAVVVRAHDLGASVVVEPFDIPPVRSAVLGDPAGARFTVSAFNPG